MPPHPACVKVLTRLHCVTSVTLPDPRSVTGSRRHLAQLLRDAAPIINAHADQIEWLRSTVRNLERRLQLVETQLERLMPPPGEAH